MPATNPRCGAERARAPPAPWRRAPGRRHGGRAVTGPRLTIPPLAAAAFAPTTWSTAEGKAAFANALLHFLEADCPRAQWRKPLYQRLSLSFGMIAHYDAAGFWAHYFDSRAGKVSFLRDVLAHGCWGSPDHTFCDVEREVIRRLRLCRTLEAHLALLAAEREVAERAELARLRAKYDGVPPTRHADLPIFGSPPPARRRGAKPDAGPTLL